MEALAAAQQAMNMQQMHAQQPVVEMPMAQFPPRPAGYNQALEGSARSPQRRPVPLHQAQPALQYAPAANPNPGQLPTFAAPGPAQADATTNCINPVTLAGAACSIVTIVGIGAYFWAQG